MASTRKLTKSLTRSLTRKLTGAELNRLFLDLCKTFSFPLVHESDFSADADNVSVLGSSMTTSVLTGNNDGIGGRDDVLRLTIDASSGGRFHLLKSSVGTDTDSTYEVTFDYLTGGGGFANKFFQLGSAFASTLDTTGTVDAKIVADTTWRSVTLKGKLTSSNNLVLKICDGTAGSVGILGSSVAGQTIYFKNIKVKKENLPVAAFSLRKLGNVSPYAARIRRSSDNTEAQVFFDASDRVSESSVVRNTSQNLLDYSEDFGEWTVVNSVALTANQTDPLGGQNAYLLQSTATSGTLYADRIELRNIALSAGQNYTASVYIKQGPLDGRLRVQLYDDANSTQIGFVDVDFSSEGVPSTASFNSADSINYEAIGSDGWYRMSFAAINTTLTADAEFKIFPDRQSGNDDVYIFGAMLEETVTYESTGTEKITNGDFSNGLTGWSENNADVGGGTITVTNEEARIITSSDSSNFVSIFRSVNWTAGKKYKINFDVTINSATTGNGGLSVVTGTSGTTNYNLTGSGGSTTLTAGVLSSQTIEVVYPSTNSNSLVFKRRGAGDVNDFTIDNISVLEYDPIPSEYISTPVVSNDGLTFTESTLDDFVGGENKLTHSEQFSSWGVYNAVRTADTSVTDPFGGTSAYKLNETAVTDFQFVNLDPVMGASKHTFSAYLKAGERTTASLLLTQAGNFGAVFDLSAGTVSSVTGTGNTAAIEAVGNQGWFRCSVTNDGSSDIFDTARIGLQGGALGSITGEANKGIYIFGAQLNTDSLKKYQKTTGSARDGNAGIVVLYNQTGGEDAIQSTQAHQPLLYNAGLLVRSGSSPAIEFLQTSPSYSNLEMNGINAARLDAWFVADTSSTQYIYPSAHDDGNKHAWIAQDGNSNVQAHLDYGGEPVRLYANGSLVGGYDITRDAVHTGLNGRKLVHHQDADTADWSTIQVGWYGQGSAISSHIPWSYEGKMSEMIFFDSDQSANKTAIEQDLNDFHNIF